MKTAERDRVLNRLHTIDRRASRDLQRSAPQSRRPAKEEAMLASMLGLGPHEMTAWLWAFSVGLTTAFVALAALSFSVALRVTGRLRRSDG